MRPVCYLNPLKSNARAVLEAFAAGSGAEIVTDLQLRAGRPAVLYGVDNTTEQLYRQIVEVGHEHFYIDNGYFASKWQGGGYYRVTRNAPQHSGHGHSDGKRWAALGKAIAPWTTPRHGHVLVALQSDYWHQRHGHGGANAFAELTVAELARHTGRTVRVRGKPLARADGPLSQDLENCWAVVVHSSNVAVDALLAGVPVFCTGPCAAATLGLADLAQIESPVMPERMEWAKVLADNQWTLDEIRAGLAWRALQ